MHGATIKTLMKVTFSALLIIVRGVFIVILKYALMY